MASSVLIFGGSGKVAKHLTTLLATSPSKKYTVHNILRTESQIPEIRSLGGTPHLHSLESTTPDALAALLSATRPDVVVFAAGAGGKGGPERAVAVDQEGAIRSMDAASAAGVPRFLMVSAVDIRDREGRPAPEWYDDGDRGKSDTMWEKIGHYCRAKLAADRSLVTENGRRGLRYTILRPGTLSEEAGTGKINAGKIHIAPSIPRQDVARTILEIIEQDAFENLVYDIVGGETPIKDAVAKVTQDKVNTFEGRY